ncbi:ribosomal protein S18-alanine N-acetyltransferase [Chromobacterium subtsugae]|uniref:[Ribosomal protein bS18]-alanine N-acetyltransferase n=1 Tax=Chromobacterium subtsugae TaxID=251747 RepID=A0ABS7FA23_9NEIS|nr:MULTISPECIES: ribosomal protein S18-alanine N-acetyltransferase [Chromobacterium]KUM02043.1 ribosomal-protein-alanine acetyltransferase [Chromobacterium subtsugae]KZE87046.1 ribosomal-protein-alanine acetyltransferase [Chromobacterium sp. F49]MBW7566022.1 ribosomal protein S18-alanine N-acetyltransferase [Chromobacterium subtsugae]MBW8286938.1 ribosomal protein S18-alanine N-acetyltransferase [Chromobacterium subtsugae]WSE93016.1 ribosomal protein S18-alanine N-acetyltransferase [Chromobact
MSVVRPFSPDDPQRLADIERQAAGHAWSAGQYRDAIAAGYPCYGVFDDSDALQGFMLVMRALDEAEILNIVIAKSNQGLGLGRQLLRHAMLDLAASGCRRLFLEVRESNAPALRLYQHCQFRQCGMRKHYYPTQDGREHAILMEAAL